MGGKRCPKVLKLFYYFIVVYRVFKLLGNRAISGIKFSTLSKHELFYCRWHNTWPKLIDKYGFFFAAAMCPIMKALVLLSQESFHWESRGPQHSNPIHQNPGNSLEGQRLPHAYPKSQVFLKSKPITSMMQVDNHHLFLYKRLIEKCKWYIIFFGVLKIIFF